MTGATLLSHGQAANDINSQESDATSPPIFVLKITRGRTRHPERPCWDERFLIGSGETCQLRLGADDIPPLHSLIHMDGGDVFIDAISPVPPLRVNGESVRSAMLRVGDVVDLGDYEFTMRAINAPAINGRFDEIELESFLAEDDELQAIEELSASQLVELIEQEEAELAERIGRAEMGASGLLHELNRRMEAMDEKSLPQHPLNKASLPIELSRAAHLPVSSEEESGLVGEIERIIGELDGFSHQLDERSVQMSEREENFSNSTMALLDVQQRVTEQLESLLQQVSSLQKEVKTVGPLRHSA